MQEQLVSFSTAELAKEKGFDWEVRHFYYNEFMNNELSEFQYYEMDRNYSSYTGYPEDLLYMVPTQVLLQKWIREVHEIYLFPILYTPESTIGFSFYIIHKKDGRLTNLFNWNHLLAEEYQGGIGKGSGIVFNTYEDALERGLLIALNLINNENKNSQ